MARTITLVTSETCLPCKLMKKMLIPYKNITSIVDSTKDYQLACSLEVSSLPCTIIYDGVTEVKRFVGLVGIGSIEKALEE